MNTPTRPNTVFHIQRIYDFHTAPPHSAAIFADRLHPRGIAKIHMKNLILMKDLTLSIALRRWHHESPQNASANLPPAIAKNWQKRPPKPRSVHRSRCLKPTPILSYSPPSATPRAPTFPFCWII